MWTRIDDEPGFFVMFLSEGDKDQLRSHKPKPISLPVYNNNESTELDYGNVSFWKTYFLTKRSSMWKWCLQAEFDIYLYFLKHIERSYSTHINRYISCGLCTNICSFWNEYYYAHSNNVYIGKYLNIISNTKPVLGCKKFIDFERHRTICQRTKISKR